MLLRSTLLCVSAGALCGAEFVLHEGSLSLLSPPRDFDWSLQSSVVSASGSDAFDSGGVVDLGGRWSWSRPGSAWGFIYGADLLWWGQNYGSADGLTLVAGRVCAGAGYALGDAWMLTAQAGLGYGWSTLNLPATASSTAFSGDGTSVLLDVRAQVLWHVSRRVSVSAQVGFLQASHEFSADDTTITMDQSGLMVGLGLSWRLSDAPPRLE